MDSARRTKASPTALPRFTQPQNLRMEPTPIKIQTPRTARYYMAGELSPHTEEVWMVFHGYGQLGSYFIRHFQPLATAQRAVVAPEGLSRFYLGDNQWERVGATWMTKEDREDEIADQQTYLDAIWQQVTAQAPNVKRVVVLGFSQGVATAWRWVDQTSQLPGVQHFIAWAGMAPAEYNRLPQRTGMKIWVVYGNQDPFITPERTEAIRQIIAGAGLPVSELAFEGGHVMDADTLQQIVKQIA